MRWGEKGPQEEGEYSLEKRRWEIGDVPKVAPHVIPWSVRFGSWLTPIIARHRKPAVDQVGTENLFVLVCVGMEQERPYVDVVGIYVVPHLFSLADWVLVVAPLGELE